MTRSGTPVSVINDIGVLRDVLVQGPVCSPEAGMGWGGERGVDPASRQHQRMVRELEAAGVSVRRMDVLLRSALGFADARDWILERRMTGADHELGNAGCDIISWLSEQPAETLTRCLMEGMKTGDLPSGFERVGPSFDENSHWLLPPLDGVMHLRERFRVIDGGVVLAQPKGRSARANTITLATVLNFAPLFDQSRFEFWLSADGADRSCPPVSGNDIAMPGDRIWVGAITANTSVQALSLLAASLFRQDCSGAVFWLDLTGTDCACLDDCFLPLSRDCMLVDENLLGRANSFLVRSANPGAPLGIEPCRLPFLDALAEGLAVKELDLIDVRHQQPPVSQGLRRLAPIVLSPGRIIAFEEHQDAFRVLEQHGIEIVAAISGGALSPEGKGPRGLVSPLHAT
ncbi:arginine deiminase family protein [Hoeflea alexandrii]|uniref:arginine deiminase family protein n=1 Tax=Hoeflea alexandrii TaxID=288436 RepID=UPI0035CFF0FA